MSVDVSELLDRLVGRTIRDVIVPAEQSRDAPNGDERPIPVEVWLDDGTLLWITAWYAKGKATL